MTYDGLRFFLPRPQCKAYYSLSMSMMHSMLGGEIFPLVSDTNCLANHRISQPLFSPHLSQRIDTKQIDTFLSDMKALGPSTLTQYRRYSPSQLHHYPPLTHTHVFNEGLSARARSQFPSPLSVCWRRRPQDDLGWFLSLNVLLRFMVPMLDFKRQPTFFSSLSPHLAWKASTLSLSLDHLR